MSDQCTCITDKEMTCIVHPTVRDLKERIATQQARIEALEAELEKYSEYTICDCCQSLTLEPVDAGGHMQCVSCTKLAELRDYIRVMVEKAAAKHRPAYDEQQRRIADIKAELAALRAHSELLRETLLMFTENSSVQANCPVECEKAEALLQGEGNE